MVATTNSYLLTPNVDLTFALDQSNINWQKLWNIYREKVTSRVGLCVAFESYTKANIGLALGFRYLECQNKSSYNVNLYIACTHIHTGRNLVFK